MSDTIAVVGAGIVGLACARELQRRQPDAHVIVMEREHEVGTQQTGHNSGVIHAGIYYAPGSLKAQLCVSGAREMYEFCEAHEVPVERRGKLIVALDRAQLAGLDELEHRGSANGVEGLLRLSSGELSEREPAVVGVGALWSPNTGIVDFGAVAAALKQQFLAAGGELQLGVEVASICTGPGSPRLSFSEAEPIEVGHALVCAGAWSHRLLDDADLRIVPFKGTYLNLKGHRSRAVRSMIYPVPDPALPFLGVHLTPTIDGRLTIGPTARLAAARGYGRVSARDLLDTVAWPGTPRLMARHWRSGIDELRMAVSRRSIVARAAAYVPSLSLDDIEPGGWHGVRAQAVARDGSLVDDFVFSQTGRVLHVLNAPSPAATSALAIARHVADRFDAAFN